MIEFTPAFAEYMKARVLRTLNDWERIGHGREELLCDYVLDAVEDIVEQYVNDPSISISTEGASWAMEGVTYDRQS